MSRPAIALGTVASGLEAWDSVISDAFEDIQNFIQDLPYPMPRFGVQGDLPTASQFDDCLAIVQVHSVHGLVMAYSTAGAWKYQKISNLFTLS